QFRCRGPSVGYRFRFRSDRAFERRRDHRARARKRGGMRRMRGSGKAWLWMAFGALGCGEEPDDFARPTAVAFSPSGDIYVADGYDHGRIVRFDSDGCWLGSFGERGLGRGQFEVP